MLKILIVDDHALVREGSRRLLALEPDMSVVGDCRDAPQALAWLAEEASDVDVVVMDLSLPGRSGLELLREVRTRWPALRLLVLSMHDSAAMLDQALRAGADGFLTKASDPTALAPAIRRVACGERVVSEDLEALIAANQTVAARGPAPHEALEPREFEVLLLLAQGVSLDAIAQRLGVSPKRVANVQTIIRRTLGVQSGIELLRYAREHGLVMD